MKRWQGILLLVVIAAFSAGRCPAQTAYEIEDDTPAANDANPGVVSLDFKDANLKDILKVFSQQSGLNFVASKSVEDKMITLYMRDVQVEDALRTLLEANNLTLMQTPGSNILIVKEKPTPPVETITRVYRIRYFHGRVKPGEEDKGSSDNNESMMHGAWQEIIKPLLSQYGSVVAFANLIIVTDVPDRFKLIDQVVSEIDKPIAEVMLEVELIETTADFWKKAGVKWGEQLLEYSGPATITPFPFQTWEKVHNPISSFNANSPISGNGDVGADFEYGLVSAKSLSFIMSLLESDTNSKFLSKPRLLVQDREWAELKIVADQIVSLKQDVTIQSGIRTVEIEVERMEVGTVLRLVPVINEEEGYVSMLLEPSISRPVASVFTDQSGQAFIDPHRRSIRTVVMVKDGETVAVGGFITTEDEETKTKMPIIGDLPFVGNFFKHNSNAKVDKELLIFITPHIVRATRTVDLAGASAEVSPMYGTASAAGTGTSGGVAEAPPPAEPTAAASASATTSFREQEDLRLDLTLKSQDAKVLNLVR